MMRSFFRRLVSSLPVALAGCMGVMPAPVAGGGGGPVGGTLPGADPRQEVARLVNEHRARIGCPPLAWDALAAGAAQAHSDDMARRNYFSHTTPEGQGMAERFRARGISFRNAAENIAYGQQTAQDVVRGWLNSPGHRQNIENCALRLHGVGLAATRWTHVFYTPLQ